MGGTHTDAVIGVRADRAERDATHVVLRDQGWNLQAFVVACMAAVRADPVKFLRYVARYRPQSKPVGRPRRRQPDA